MYLMSKESEREREGGEREATWKHTLVQAVYTHCLWQSHTV